ncbi:MAG TPA: hypothetical protein VFZ96_09625 [Actinomycetota bacterium]|nr:hypothetical protein [Actinomycetota bacterium]
MIEAEPVGSEEPLDERVAGASLFRAPTGGVAGELADRIGGRGPFVTGLAAWGAAFAILAVVIVGLGVLLTRVVLPAGLGPLDVGVSRWFVERR